MEVLLSYASDVSKQESGHARERRDQENRIEKTRKDHVYKNKQESDEKDD